jgi:hypothetical protein
VTTATSGPIIPARDRLTLVARAIEPILNRVVLAGPPVVDLLANDPTVRIPSIAFAADSTLQFLSTSMVDRLGADLKKIGLARIGRTATGNRWQAAEQVALDLIQVRSDNPDPSQVWLEYATLLTLPFAVDDRLVVRIASAPAMLALECAAFARRGGNVLDSEEIERVVTLIAARPAIERECAAAPAELREFIAAELGRLSRNDTLELLVQRVLPDAARLASFTRRVTHTMRRMAARC